MTIDGETFVLIKVVDIDEASVGDYVLYQDIVVLFNSNREVE